jgi:hypothetical protein
MSVSPTKRKQTESPSAPPPSPTSDQKQKKPRPALTQKEITKECEERSRHHHETRTPYPIGSILVSHGGVYGRDVKFWRVKGLTKSKKSMRIARLLADVKYGGDSITGTYTYTIDDNSKEGSCTLGVWTFQNEWFVKGTSSQASGIHAAHLDLHDGCPQTKWWCG